MALFTPLGGSRGNSTALLLTFLAITIVVIVALIVGRARVSGCVMGASTVGCVREGTDSTELRVMTFNLWGGGLAGGMPLQRSADVIARARPEVVGLQEPAFEGADQLPELARLTGMTLVPEANILTSLSVAASWRLGGKLSNNRGMGGARLRLADGREVFVYNVHLTAYPYGPHAIRDGEVQGGDVSGIMEVEKPRLEEIELVLQDIGSRVPEDGRVILLGDFNAPSHRDWATPTARTYNTAVRWPVSAAIERAGFVDVFRALYPDAVDRSPAAASPVVRAARPGFTYSPITREDNDHVPSDRIDMIFARGPLLRLCEALVVGEPGEFTDIAVSPWPSDHRAVLAYIDWDAEA